MTHIYRFFFSLSFVLLSLNILSQTIVEGKTLIKEDQTPLPFVNISGLQTDTYSTSNVMGDFSIEVPSSESGLIFSAIGFKTDTVLITGKFLTILLSDASTELGDVVVTALGIERDKKSIGYSITEIDGSDIEKSNDQSVVNRLSGKVAGLQISSTNGGAGSSSRIILRGNNSLTGDNQALIVVDGVPINNSTTSNSGDEWGGSDYGNGVSDINPDDVESITVLKGASASALYGSAAMNGVILITTKTGSAKKKIGVSYNSNTSVETAYILYDLQNKYGAGRNGKFEGAWSTIDGMPVFNSSVDFSKGSWGPEMNGQIIVDWDGNERAFSPQPDNYKDYFQRGTTFNNSLSIDGGNKKVNFRFSAANISTKDIVPNSKISRSNAGLKLNANISKRLKLSTYLNYVHNKADNRPALSDSHNNPNRNYIHMPRHISSESLKNHIQDENGNEVTWYGNWNWMTNPYWNIQYQLNGDQRKRLFGNASLNYEFSPKLKLMVRTAPDTYTTEYFSRDAQFGLINGVGKYSSSEDSQFLINSDFLATYNSKINKNISYSLNFGGNAMYYTNTVTSRNTEGGLVIPNVYSIENSLNPIYERTFDSEAAKNSLYTFGQLEFKEFLFLDISFRNDWSSTLPDENNSFLYNSTSLGFVYSSLFNREKIKEKIFSFGKLRVSYAGVGNEAEPYQLETTYETTNNEGFGEAQFINRTVPNLGLLPELVNSFEIGSDMKFFYDRFGLDITYYDSKSFNQISNIPVSAASGYNSAIVNNGIIKNSGIEIELNITPIEKQNFKWSFNTAFAKNKSKIVELGPNVESAVIYEHWRLTIEARPNSAYGDIVGYGFLRNENGAILVDNLGMAIRDETPKILGNFTPDFSLSMSHTFNYKNWNLGFLIHGQFGGDLFSGTNLYGYGYAGNFEETLKGREEWYASEAAREDAGISSENWNATGGYLIDGVYTEGTSINGVDVSGNSNSTYIDPYLYYTRLSQWQEEIHEPFVYDASFIKLREMNIGYKFSTVAADKIKLKGLSLGIYGSNIWLIHSNIPNIDPESALTNGNGQGYELYSYPNRRSFGFFIKAFI